MFSLATIGIIGLITGAVVGTAKLVDYIIGNNDAIDELNIEKGNLEEQYSDKIDTATLEYNQSKAKQELDYKQTNEKLDNDYNQAVKNTTLNFETSKKEAYHNADVSDEKETFNEWIYSKELNSQLDILTKNQKMAAQNYNSASVAMGQNQGQALSNVAASGTRGSSMNTAIELEAATNATQLQLTQDQQRARDSANLSSVLLQGAANNFNIQQARNANNYLRASYREGGSQYNLYQNALADLNQNYNLAKNQTQERNTQNLSQLKDSYDQYVTSTKHIYDQNDAKIQRQLDDKQDFWKNFLRGGTALLGGSIEGFNTGTKTATSISNYFAR